MADVQADKKAARLAGRARSCKKARADTKQAKIATDRLVEELSAKLSAETAAKLAAERLAADSAATAKLATEKNCLLEEEITAKTQVQVRIHNPVQQALHSQYDISTDIFLRGVSGAL